MLGGAARTRASDPPNRSASTAARASRAAAAGSLLVRPISLNGSLFVRIQARSRDHRAGTYSSIEATSYRTPITLEEVLAQPMIVAPLGLFEVPSRGDGAVCLVPPGEVARATVRPYVRLPGRGFFHEGAHQISDMPGDKTRLVAAEVAGAGALGFAGITAGDGA